MQTTDFAGPPLLFVLSGFAGSGKTTLAGKLEGKCGLQKCITITTRKKRDKEIDGVHYHFRPLAELRYMQARGDILECAAVHGKPGEADRYYATPVSSVVEPLRAGKRLILSIDVQGHSTLRRHRYDLVREAIWSVFLVISKDTMVRRMRSRGDNEDEIDRRVSSYEAELREADHYDLRLPNPDGHLEIVASDLEKRVERLMIERSCFR